MAAFDGSIVPLPRPARRKQLGRFGEFEVMTPLARGGMGGVYLALHHETGEQVALKVLDPQFAAYPEVVARLFAEHTVAASVAHPGLVEIRDARLTDDGVPYLVMEYLEGMTLGAIADVGEIDLSTIIAVTAQVAAALAALHAAGFVHCDVKHDNVFVLDDTLGDWPRVKVIDFGVSRAVDEPPLADATIAGTPWCMAPEQWSGAPTTKSDVYALGCMLYDLTTGAPPFDGSLPELMIAHLEQRPSRPSWLRAMPIELERIILRALAKNPDVRPTMADIAVSLAELMDRYPAVELRRAG
ncbi:MAG: serine/threonine protein kinase [Deltaproteobacteria bacterium]|nr:serine/threonine protein kinase [Deltaproteobacteria bacterium]